MDRFGGGSSLEPKLGNEPFVGLCGLQMRCYFPYESRALSVMRVTESKTFDEIGYPVRGGLYDPAMGPTEPTDVCPTCQLYGAHCPGHLGHIQLDVPVFNPVLMTFMFELLKGTCVHCSRFTCNARGVKANLVTAQMQCLDMGLCGLAEELQGAIEGDAFAKVAESETGGKPVTFSEELSVQDQLDAIIRHRLGKRLSDFQCDSATKRVQPVRSAVEQRKELMKHFCRDQLFKRKGRCPLCKNRIPTYRNDGSRCVLLDFGSDTKTKKQTKCKATVSQVKSQLLDYDEEIDAAKVEDSLEESLVKIHEYEEMNFAFEDTVTGRPQNIVEKQLASVLNGSCDKLAWRGAELREHFRRVWQNDGHLLERLFPIFRVGDKQKAALEGCSCPLDILFMDTVLVPPPKFRPMRLMKGEKCESPQTLNLRLVLEATETVKAVNLIMAQRANPNDTRRNYSKTLEELVNQRVAGKTLQEKLHNAYILLQTKVSVVYDNSIDRMVRLEQRIPGIKQLLEKKEGLFRMNMMGKRVNYACRSVITPDPYLDIDEIGIPDIFAKKLTFHEPVNATNLANMRKIVATGPDVHPGANAVHKGINKQRLFNARPDDESKRAALAATIMPSDPDRIRTPAVVLRHLIRGDMMLMNRQPTLHKPSIMAHKARVLRKQRALRLNYAPCKAYNADFDGDEMNGHLVQNRLAATELREIAIVGRNYLVPKDGSPIMGLIQDHVVSGVLLTLRDRFFNGEDYQHLLLNSFGETSRRFRKLPPAICKPQRLWTGKQVVSTVVLNVIPSNKPRFNLEGKAKTPVNCWQVDGHEPPKFNMSESEVIFRQGELVCGVLDKAHYGATQFGLVHCCYELYGPGVATQLLSCFSRLFTSFLQLHGFSLGVGDILVEDKPNRKRRRVIKKLRNAGDEVTCKVFGLDKDTVEQSKIHYVVATAYCNPRGTTADVQQLDFTMKQSLDQYNDAINKAVIPHGLMRRFPANALQLMIQSGAKGTMVNSMQISCGLGQIELEGHRPPVNAAGRTLPSFQRFDSSPRAGGFVDQRFLTGVEPQELFFHTMAGREGLIDTAVKTSRSGYLQRCIIKHLEGIVVQYDSTARDADGTVVQFRYGEDGMDVGKSQFLRTKQFDFLRSNVRPVEDSVVPKDATDEQWHLDKSEKHFKKVSKWKRSRGKEGVSSGKIKKSGFTHFALDTADQCPTHLQTPMDRRRHFVNQWHALGKKERMAYEKNSGGHCPEAVVEVFNPARTLGSLPEKLLEQIGEFVNEEESSRCGASKDELKRVLYWKGLRAQCDPGECVGLLAAQSIGEPSTQMTLNTFHFAGRGEMNVTLGIPRLREILMTASKNIATPSAQITAKPGVTMEDCASIKRELDRVYLKQVLKKITLEERINVAELGEQWRRYTLTLHILRPKHRDEHVRYISCEKIVREVETRFARTSSRVLKKRFEEAREHQEIMHHKMRSGNAEMGIGGDVGGDGDGPSTDVPKANKDDEGASSDEEGGGADLDAGEARMKNRHGDDNEYEGEDDDKEEVEPNMQTEVLLDLSESDTEAEEGVEKENVPEGGEDEEFFHDERKPKVMNQERVGMVLKCSSEIVDYAYDTKGNRWCSITFELPLRCKSKLDVGTIMRSEVEKFIVHETPGIEKCIMREENGRVVLQTQGVNLPAFFKHAELLDVNTVYSNDLHVLLHSYGVEACAKALVKEVNGVFQCYGIEVNSRHLTLLSDYMTLGGQIRAFNRGYMSTCASPLQKMTFETTTSFMRDALVAGEFDDLSSPSANIVVGQMMRGGTGAFDLFIPTDHALNGGK